MNNIQPNDILESIFRANPEYELVLFERLPAEQRDMLRDLRKDPDFYGVLRPIEKSGLGVKSVSRDTALLFLSLQQPGPLPRYVQASLGDRCSHEITRLVLDGVLAVERAGKFVTGPEASALIYRGTTDTPTAPSAEGFLERLSLEALRYGQSLDLAEPMMLSSRLYGYNRTPLSPYWSRILRDTAAMTNYLGIGEGPVRAALDREWVKAPNSASNDGWLAWQSRRLDTRASFGGHTTILCKLYISPTTDHLSEVVPLILAVLGRTGVRHFKVGKDAPGLLRPDKMVAYFGSFSDLFATAEELKKDLAGCPSHGVPFTAELAGDGLLSWGVDPPADDQALPWIGRESWRLWVTNRLAVALVSAGAKNTGNIEPWQFALQRLQLEGVDTRSWTPAGTDWKRGVGAES